MTPRMRIDQLLVSRGLFESRARAQAAIDAGGAFLATLGWEELGLMESPIAGGDGNREFLLGA